MFLKKTPLVFVELVRFVSRHIKCGFCVGLQQDSMATVRSLECFLGVHILCYSPYLLFSASLRPKRKGGVS